MCHGVRPGASHCTAMRRRHLAGDHERLPRFLRGLHSLAFVRPTAAKAAPPVTKLP